MATIDLGVLLTKAHGPGSEEKVISTCLRHRCGTIYLALGFDGDLKLFEKAGLTTKSFAPRDLHASLIDGNTAFLFLDKIQTEQAEKDLNKAGVPTICPRTRG